MTLAIEKKMKVILSFIDKDQNHHSILSLAGKNPYARVIIAAKTIIIQIN